jgi:hypothetical protein
MNQCLTCEYWEGDKTATHKLIESGGDVVMDRVYGYSGWGKCALSYEWLDIVITGDAYADGEVQANFGCIYHENQKENDNACTDT